MERQAFCDPSAGGTFLSARFLLLFGPPGAGKGTQAGKIASRLGIPHISTGEMFRDHLKRQTSLGHRVREILGQGCLVPNEITNAMVEDRLSQADSARGCLLDGYPRNVLQARFLGELLQERGHHLNGVLVLRVPDDILIQRLHGRAIEQNRPDDADEMVVRSRLKTYREESEPCLQHYRSVGVPVMEIDGVGTVEEVAGRFDLVLRNAEQQCPDR